MTARLTVLLVLACVVAVMAAPALGQVPSIQVYSIGTFDQEFIGCYPPGTLTQLYVVLLNFPSDFSAVDFTIDYPPGLVWLGDELPHPPSMASLGNSPNGIAIAWGTCCMPDVSAGPVVLLRPFVMAGQCDCGGGVAVRGYGPLGKSDPTVVTYPDFAEHSVLGHFTPMCRPVGVETTTWGRVKSLYR